jgi:hypothetical protein
MIIALAGCTVSARTALGMLGMLLVQRQFKLQTSGGGGGGGTTTTVNGGSAAGGATAAGSAAAGRAAGSAGSAGSAACIPRFAIPIFEYLQQRCAHAALTPPSVFPA